MEENAGRRRESKLLDLRNENMIEAAGLFGDECLEAAGGTAARAPETAPPEEHAGNAGEGTAPEQAPGATVPAGAVHVPSELEEMALSSKEVQAAIEARRREIIKDRKARQEAEEKAKAEAGAEAGSRDGVTPDYTFSDEDINRIATELADNGEAEAAGGNGCRPGTRKPHRPSRIGMDSVYGIPGENAAPAPPDSGIAAHEAGTAAGQPYFSPFEGGYPRTARENGTAAGYTYESIEQPPGGNAVVRQKVISVYSPKGGVGKSSITQALACAFAHPDARIDGRNLRVLLADFDWEYPDDHTLFSVAPAPNLYRLIDVMRADRKKTGRIQPYYDRRILEGCVIHVNERLDILAGSENPSEYCKLDVELVEALIRNMCSLPYDVVIFDNANSSQDITFTALENSDDVVLISTLDFSTVDEIGRFLSTARERQFDLRKVHLLINDVPAKIGPNIPTPEQIVDAYGLDYMASIPSDPDVKEYNNAALPYMWSRNSTAFTKAVREVANGLLPVFGSERRGLLGRLFGRRR